MKRTTALGLEDSSDTLTVSVLTEGQGCQVLPERCQCPTWIRNARLHTYICLHTHTLVLKILLRLTPNCESNVGSQVAPELPMS
jgi:hypothetical protein